MYYNKSNKHRPKNPQKRGALCIDAKEEEHKVKRRSYKKHVEEQNVRTALQYEAEDTITKLTHSNRCKPSTAGLQGDTNSNCTYAERFEIILRKYTKKCNAKCSPIFIDQFHDMDIECRSTATQIRRPSKMLLDHTLSTAQFRTACASLIVSLWISVCNTPYMLEGHNSSYRPFVCGCLYAMKRGVYLRDGSVVLPMCTHIADALPSLRGENTSSITKTLHSSSHRGLCTLNKAIASVPVDRQAIIFANCKSMAMKLMSMCN
jgi:hypothetical protein